MTAESARTITGTVIKIPDATPGLVFAGGRQLPFVMEGVWHSAIAPATNQTVEVSLDSRDRVASVVPTGRGAGAPRKSRTAIFVAVALGGLLVVGLGIAASGGGDSHRSRVPAEAENLLPPAPPPENLEPDEGQVARARAFLDQKGIARDIVSMFLHFGADFRGHQLASVGSVVDSAGHRLPRHFSISYHYQWESDGWTDVAFLYDDRGHLQSVQVLKTNAELSAPFALAKLSCVVVGEFLNEALKDDLNDTDRAKLHELVAGADVKSILEWYLRLAQSRAG
jgi:hypothetical protein